ncbi:TSUP family transporter, partial [Roseateles sp. GG27B]
MFELITVALASLLAGFVDAVVGGGGLVLVPALFGAFPQAAPATLFGTNKAASVWGTAWATGQFARRVTLNWRALLPAAAVALLGSAAGAWTVTLVSAEFLRRGLPFILLASIIYTLSR